jgi:hypothetical protein
MAKIDICLPYLIHLDGKECQMKWGKYQHSSSFEIWYAPVPSPSNGPNLIQVSPLQFGQKLWFSNHFHITRSPCGPYHTWSLFPRGEPLVLYTFGTSHART